MAEEGAVSELLDKMGAERGRILAYLDGLRGELDQRRGSQA